jgi:hypothetical protein
VTRCALSEEEEGVLCLVFYIYRHISNRHSNIIMLVATRKYSTDGLEMTSALLVATLFDSSDH